MRVKEAMNIVEEYLSTQTITDPQAFYDAVGTVWYLRIAGQSARCFNDGFIEGRDETMDELATILSEECEEAAALVIRRLKEDEALFPLSDEEPTEDTADVVS